jgi:hypothetical protein
MMVARSSYCGLHPSIMRTWSEAATICAGSLNWRAPFLTAAFDQRQRVGRIVFLAVEWVLNRVRHHKPSSEMDNRFDLVLASFGGL